MFKPLKPGKQIKPAEPPKPLTDEERKAKAMKNFYFGIEVFDKKIPYKMMFSEKLKKMFLVTENFVIFEDGGKMSSDELKEFESSPSMANAIVAMRCVFGNKEVKILGT